MLCKVCVHNHTAEAHGTQPTTTSAHVLRIANEPETQWTTGTKRNLNHPLAYKRNVRKGFNHMLVGRQRSGHTALLNVRYPWYVWYVCYVCHVRYVWYVRYVWCEWYVWSVWNLSVYAMHVV